MRAFTSTVSRRDFLKYCGTVAVLIGLSREDGQAIAQAAESASSKPPVIWLEAQGCGGCLRSFTGSENPDAARLLLELLSFRFIPGLESAAGESLFRRLSEREPAQHILLVEGTIPLGAGGRFCTVGAEGEEELTAAAAVRRFSKNAAAIVAAGTCAAFGGIPASDGGNTGARRLASVLPGDKIVNVSGCPPHPDWLIATIMHTLLFGTIPARDSDGRPTMFYGKTVHALCERRAAFDEGRFVESFADHQQQDERCLLLLGCKGPVAHGDCPRRRWNDGTNWCVGAGAPCIGCTEPAFYNGLSPVLSRLPDVDVPFGGARTTVETVGKVIVGGTAAVIAGHAIVAGTSRLVRARRKETDRLHRSIKKGGGQPTPGAPGGPAKFSQAPQKGSPKPPLTQPSPPPSNTDSDKGPGDVDG